MLRTTADNRRQAPKPARSDSISPRPLETLQDLLESIRCGEPEQVHLLSMLTATAAHISMVLGVSSDKIHIRALLDVRFGLRCHLGQRGYRRNSVRSYVNYLRILIQKARELGWA